jgi:hypothetical protein
MIDDFIYFIYYRQHQTSKQATVTDGEWIQFIRLIVQKPLENDLKMLLDKYKMVNISFKKINIYLFIFIRLILIVSMHQIQLMQLFVLLYVIWRLRYIHFKS